MKTSVMFLLGSGISIPAGFPSTSDLTTQVFAGNNIVRGTDSRYYWSVNKNTLEDIQTNEYLPTVLKLLKTIKQLMESYDKNEPLNYEILYYFIQQLNTYESGDLLNMALSPFIKQVKKKMRLSHDARMTRYIELFNEAEVYIRHTVWAMLAKVTLNKHRHLAFLSDAFNDKDISIVNVATLNHDLLIERHLDDHKISFNDGFSAPVNAVRYWENCFSTKNNLLKIHGSINWFTLKPDNGGWFDEKIGIVLNGDIDHTLSPSGNRMESMPDKEPLILVGTFNKIYEYTESIFNDIYYQFRSQLRTTKNLIVSGYSFGDKGVNAAILDWLYTNRDNKITLIHPDPNALLIQKARLAVRKAYEGPAKRNFVTITKKIQDTSWQDIKAAI